MTSLTDEHFRMLIMCLFLQEGITIWLTSSTFLQASHALIFSLVHSKNALFQHSSMPIMY